jgi:RNA polymerase sigma-70 factor (ECF subfamily)
MTTFLEQTENTTIVSLVIAAQEGDRDAFGQLCAHYERSIYNVVFRRLSNHAEAQELTQEVFVQALQKLAQLREPVCFGGWLRSIAKRMSINRAVRRPPEFATEHEAIDLTHGDEETPYGQAVRNETRKQVRAGMRRLGKLDRKTLEAFYVQGHSLVEMAAEFDAPVGTIKRRLHVARKRLAEQLVELAPA